MEDKFKKIEKDFLLSDSSLNSYKYRLLTSGYLMAEFAKNPIGYFMHGTEEYPREEGVLVKWENLRVDGDKVFGKPCINLSHPRGQRTVDEIESGFLNAASFGHFVVLEVSDNPEDYLEGQEGPSVSKWFNRECSICDIPGNYNALRELFDKDNNPLQLADLIAQQNLKKMDKIFLTPQQLTLMNLTDKAEQTTVDTQIKNLVAEAAKVPQLVQDLTAANAAKKTAEDALDAYKTTTETKTIEDLIAKGVNDKKFTVEIGNDLKIAYKGKSKELNELIAKMPVYSSISTMIDKGDEAMKALCAMSYDELDKSGKAEDLLAKNPEVFKAKYKERFGTDYVDKK